MKYFALTFSDEKYIKTRYRYVAEMASKDIFSRIFSYGPEDLDENFTRQHTYFIRNSPRGYGYWIWKPHLILKVLSQMDNGDVLVYGDAGNEMKSSAIECLQKFRLVNDWDKGIKIIASRAAPPIYWYTKTDLYLKVKWYSLFYARRPMVEAGRLVIEKNNQTIRFVKKWAKICENNYRNIDDSPSFLPCLPNFIEHRHDQSVFSLLFYMNKGKIVDFGNVWKASRLKY